MPDILPQQAEHKWKNLKKQFLLYEKSKFSGSKIKRPFGYPILRSLLNAEKEQDDEDYDHSQVDTSNSIDITEFISISDSPNIRQKSSNDDDMDKWTQPQIKKFITSVQKLESFIEEGNKKLDKVCSNQEKLLAAINEKNELLKQLLKDE